MVCRALEQGADPNKVWDSVNERGMPRDYEHVYKDMAPLHGALCPQRSLHPGRKELPADPERGMSGNVALLLGAGANPNATNPKGQTPLVFSCALNSIAFVHPTVLEQLAKASRGALDTPDALGRTALSYAAEQLELPVMRALVKGGAGVEVADQQGWTPLWFVAGISSKHKKKKNQGKCLDFLTQKGARWDGVDTKGYSILMRFNQLDPDMAARNGTQVAHRAPDGQTYLGVLLEKGSPYGWSLELEKMHRLIPHKEVDWNTQASGDITVEKALRKAAKQYSGSPAFMIKVRELESHLAAWKMEQATPPSPRRRAVRL